MSAIELTDSEAVHPGYGFLSENFEFAKILEENKIKFIEESIKKNGFEKTAILYSNSISSEKGGSIGWVASKSISNKYLKEILKLDKMQISKPIKINKGLVK